MAQEGEVLLVDDLDGSQAEGTIRFRPDDTEYEIDLNAGGRWLSSGGQAAAGTISAANRPKCGA